MKKSESMNFNVYIRVIKYVKPYLRLAIMCFVVSILISIFQFASLGMLSPLGDILFEEDGTSSILQKVRNFGETGEQLATYLEANVFSSPYRALYVIMAIVAVSTVLKAIFRFLSEYFSCYISERVVIDVSNELYQKVTHQPIRFFDREGVDQIASRFTTDVNAMGKGIKSIFGSAIREPLKAMSSLAVCLWIQWQLTIMIFVVFPIAFIFIKNLGRTVKKASKKTLRQAANILEMIQESFQGRKIIKSYQMEKESIASFSKNNIRLFGYRMKVHKADAITSPLMESFITLSAIVLLILSAQMVLRGEISSGDFLLFYGALGAIFDPLRKFANVNNRINACIAAGERVFELLDAENDVKDKVNAVDVPAFCKNIEFQNVCFSYEPHSEVLKNISFQISKGEIIAIVGKNGSGKSTLISLLLRFFDPSSGKILIDGFDIQDATIKSLRQNFSLVSQKPFLFNQTILENIRSGNTTLSDEQLKEIAKQAHVEEFIGELEKGYDTIYGRGGVGLSGGQEQRISLARAMARNAPILILDEATANLDVESEEFIKDALNKHLKDSTAFIIAHRFSTIEKADRILVLNDGQIEAFGNHDEIIQTSKTYKSLYEKQEL